LLEWVRSNRGKQINGYKNHIWNGVTCLELAKLIEKIIRNNLYWRGSKHFFSPTPVSKYDLILLINKIYDLNITINPTTNGKIVDKSLSSVYSPLFNIPMLEKQIEELKQFSLS
jgi:dTDP-4-dehydrorhamnose reductase